MKIPSAPSFPDLHVAIYTLCYFTFPSKKKLVLFDWKSTIYIDTDLTKDSKHLALKCYQILPCMFPQSPFDTICTAHLVIIYISQELKLSLSASGECTSFSYFILCSTMSQSIAMIVNSSCCLSFPFPQFLVVTVIVNFIREILSNFICKSTTWIR